MAYREIPEFPKQFDSPDAIFFFLTWLRLSRAFLDTISRQYLSGTGRARCHTSWFIHCHDTPYLVDSTKSPCQSRTNLLRRGVEQLVAREAHNLEVAGSSPVPATNKSAVPPCRGNGADPFSSGGVRAKTLAPPIRSSFLRVKLLLPGRCPFIPGKRRSSLHL